MCLKEKKTIFVENNDRGETEAEGDQRKRRRRRKRVNNWGDLKD